MSNLIPATSGNFTGIDLDPRYCEIEEGTPQQPQFPEPTVVIARLVDRAGSEPAIRILGRLLRREQLFRGTPLGLFP